MKYLQLYDHLGNLVKEFEVYVDGQDFNWAAQKPEPVWLGTIKLVSEKAAVPVEPTPEFEVIPEGEVIEGLTEEEQVYEAAKADQPESEVEEVVHVNVIKEIVPVEESILPELTPEQAQEIEDLREEAEAEKCEQESEVKHEPEKRVHKSRGAKRTGPPASLEGPEAVSPRASRRGNQKGNK